MKQKKVFSWIGCRHQDRPLVVRSFSDDKANLVRSFLQDIMKLTDFTCQISTVFANKIWQINITDFYLEEHAPSGGCYDYFEVIGGQCTDHVIYRQSDNQTNVSLIQTSGRNSRIRFRTDSSINRSGFSFNYIQVDSLCGATLSANSQQQNVQIWERFHNYPIII